MKKKKIANGIVESEVADALLDNPKYTAGELKRIVEKELKRRGYNYRFTERTYLNIKNRLLPNLGEKPMDRPWTIGCCIKYDISPDVIVPHQQQLLTLNRFLTIRRARWYSKLHPVIFPLLEKAYPQQPSQNQLRLHQISSFYTRMEQIAEISGEDYPDTRVLDDMFIFNQDFSFRISLRIWQGLYRQVSERPYKLTDQKASTLKAEQILTKEITEGEAKLLNKFIKLLCAYKTDESNLGKALMLVEDNPNIQPLVEKWMALSLRRDIRPGEEEEGEK